LKRNLELENTNFNLVLFFSTFISILLLSPIVCSNALADTSFLINKSNIESHKKDLIAPIAYWIEKGIFSIRAINSNAEINDLTSSEELIRNVIKVQSDFQVSLFDVEYLWLNNDNIVRKAFFALLRKAQPFSEVFRFYEPDSINHYATKTDRDGSVDYVSHYSPVVQAVRPMLSENRSDNIVKGQISLNDIFVFSANIKNFKVRILDKKVLLVPFSNSEPAVLSKRNIIFAQNKEGNIEKFPEPELILPEQDPEKTLLEEKEAELESKPEKKPVLVTKPIKEFNTFYGGDSVAWNYNENISSKYVSWLPLSVTFEKRELLIIELNPHEPYYDYGKQILFIDTVSGAPVYKISYSKTGQYQKTVIGAWRRVSNQKLIPYFVLAVDKFSESASLIEIKNAQFYDKDEQEPDFAFLFRPASSGKTDEKSAK